MRGLYFFDKDRSRLSLYKFLHAHLSEALTTFDTA